MAFINTETKAETAREKIDRLVRFLTLKKKYIKRNHLQY